MLAICVIVLACGCVNTGDQAGKLAPAPSPGNAKAGAAPLSPEFVQYQQDLKEGKVSFVTKEGLYTGLIPEPAAIFYGEPSPEPKEGEEMSRAPFVDYYDLRTRGRLTPVRDQGSSGTCWAFAAMASMESYLLPEEGRDFAENHMRNTHGFASGPGSGGNRMMSTAYLTRWSGPLDEADDPYSAYDYSSPYGLPAQKHVLEVRFVPDRAGPLDNDRIKNAVADYGAVQTSIYYSSAYYNKSSHSYYVNASGTSNHAIDIVGWLDTYSRYNFTSTPPGNGAFICRNSWGADNPDWPSEGGYFYVSYYDSFVGRKNAVYVASPETTYDTLYEYDPYGYVYGYGVRNATGGFNETVWMANVFPAKASQSVAAVGFYAVSANIAYEVAVYHDPADGPLSAAGAVWKQRGTLEIPGYYTIPLEKEVPVAAGRNFSVVVRLTAPGVQHPIPVEAPLSGYCTRASAAPNQSYCSANGTVWLDMDTYAGDGNACLKAYMVNATLASEPVSSNLPATMAPGQRYNAAVKMRNTGTAAWSTAGGICLGTAAGGDGADFGAAQIALPPGVVVYPGQQYSWEFPLTAPAIGGNYTLRYQVMQVNGSGFGARIEKNVSVAGPVFDSAPAAVAVPASMAAGTTGNASITMRNTGPSSWSPADQFRLCPAAGDAAKFGFVNCSLSPGAVVSPGGLYTWNFTLTAPSTIGTYSLRFRVARGDAQFGDAAEATVRVSAAQYDAGVASVVAPLWMTAGNAAPASVTMSNTGNTPWSSSADVRLVALGSAPQFGGAAFSLPPGTVVSPGGRYTWNFTLTAPAATGGYELKYRLSRGSTQFGETATQNITVIDAPVPDSAIVSNTIPAQMLKGKTYTVAVTMKNTGNMPWSEQDGIRLAAEGSAAQFSGSRIYLPAGTVVMPGSSYVFRFTMVAPSTAGSYPVKYRMIWEGNQSFGATASKTVAVKTATSI